MIGKKNDMKAMIKAQVKTEQDIVSCTEAEIGAYRLRTLFGHWTGKLIADINAVLAA